MLRSIVRHFWLGHDHPFEDGNGRTARALFYWSMLRRGYWLTEYLTISTFLKKAPAKYARSFLYTEQDGNDLTYFALYHLGVVQRTIDGLNAYLTRKMKEVRSTERLLPEAKGRTRLSLPSCGRSHGPAEGRETLNPPFLGR